MIGENSLGLTSPTHANSLPHRSLASRCCRVVCCGPIFIVRNPFRFAVLVALLACAASLSFSRIPPAARNALVHRFSIDPDSMPRALRVVRCKVERCVRRFEPSATVVSVDAVFLHIGGFAPTAVIRAACQLRVADALHNGPLTLNELAAATHTPPQNLARLLRALEQYYMFRERADGRWEQSLLSDYLREDHPSSMRPLAIMMGGSHYVSMSELAHAVRTGRPAFEHVYGKDFWSYCAEHPEANSEFQSALASLSALSNPAIARDYDRFAHFTSLVDVAGGNGNLLAEIMALNPKLHGVLFERAHIIDAVKPSWQQGPLANRSSLVSGNFFMDTLPRHNQAYMLKQILHDWGDKEAVSILRNVRLAMTDGSGKRSNATLVIVDRMMQKHATAVESQGTAFADLIMMAMFATGQERFEEDFCRVLTEAGFEITRILPTRSAFFVIEARVA